MDDILLRARDAYTVRDTQFARGELPQNFLENMYQYGHILLEDLDYPGGPAFSLLHVFAKSRIVQLLKAYFCGKLALFGNNCAPRRQRPNGINAPTPYHQDSSFMGSQFVVLNTWCPLVACNDGHAPGLEVVLEPLTQRILPPHASNPNLNRYEQMELAADWVESTYGVNKIWHPELSPGDALIFSSFTIHRTYLTPEMSGERISLEFRSAKATPEVINCGVMVAVLND